MSVFARADLAHVFVSRAHGGCGQGHSRPVENGAPAKLWQVTCPQCSDFLRSDSNWSSTIAEIPETHDEKLTREDLEKRGARNQSQMTALALAKIAGIPGAEVALGMAMGAGAANCPNGHPVTPGVKFCPQCGAQVAVPSESRMFPCGHANPSAARFCAECGGPAELPNGAGEFLGVIEPIAPGAQARAVAESPHAEADQDFVDAVSEAPLTPAPPSLPSNTKMRGMKREDLAQLAAEAGLSGEGNRQVLLDRLIAANNGNKATGGV